MQMQLWGRMQIINNFYELTLLTYYINHLEAEW